MPTAVRLFDLSVDPPLQREIEGVVLETLRSHQFILGERVAAFEAQFAAAFGAPHAIGVGSGTDALVLALRALGVGPGDEVIVPGWSFYATAEAVLLVGATPVLTDVSADTLTLCPAAAAAAITPRTVALLPVHIYGQPADMPALLALAAKHHLAVVEDAAQAIGATLGGRPVGSFGDACCYSFYPTKNLGAAGDGGMLTTPHAAVADKVRQLREHARAGAYDHNLYDHNDVGYSSRLDALQAVILGCKLPHLPRWHEARRAHARHYDRAFAHRHDLRTPLSTDGHVYHLYTLRVAARDHLMQALEARAVQARVYYPHALPDLLPLRDMPNDGCPEARLAAHEVLSLPLHPNLTPGPLEHVVTSTLVALDEVLATS